MAPGEAPADRQLPDSRADRRVREKAPGLQRTAAELLRPRPSRSRGAPALRALRRPHRLRPAPSRDDRSRSARAPHLRVLSPAQRSARNGRSRWSAGSSTGATRWRSTWMSTRAIGRRPRRILGGRHHGSPPAHAVDVFAAETGNPRVEVAHLNTSPRDDSSLNGETVELFKSRNPIDYRIFEYASQRLRDDAKLLGLV